MEENKKEWKMKGNYKYKVWCKNRNEWEKHDCFLDIKGDLYQYIGGVFHKCSSLTHIVCFSTGLHDKHGKEIYEGDRIKYQDNVYIIKQCLPFTRTAWEYIEDENGNSDISYTEFLSFLEETEVIGNIYEV